MSGSDLIKQAVDNYGRLVGVVGAVSDAFQVEFRWEGSFIIVQLVCEGSTFRAYQLLLLDELA